jgi:hypothetical protein
MCPLKMDDKQIFQKGIVVEIKRNLYLVSLIIQISVWNGYVLTQLTVLVIFHFKVIIY